MHLLLCSALNHCVTSDRGGPDVEGQVGSVRSPAAAVSTASPVAGAVAVALQVVVVVVVVVHRPEHDLLQLGRAVEVRGGQTGPGRGGVGGGRGGGSPAGTLEPEGCRLVPGADVPDLGQLLAPPHSLRTLLLLLLELLHHAGHDGVHSPGDGNIDPGHGSAAAAHHCCWLLAAGSCLLSAGS